MNHRIAFDKSPKHLLAIAVAALLTVTQLGAVNLLAQQRSISPYAQIVQLERVVITAPRTQAATTASTALACEAAVRTVC